MCFAPFESPHSQLSNGAKIIKNGSILKNLWANQVDRISEPKLILIFSVFFMLFLFFHVFHVFSCMFCDFLVNNVFSTCFVIFLLRPKVATNFVSGVEL